MPAWYHWAMPPAAAMRPACVVPMQYFLCDRKAVAFTMDDIIPAISLQTSTIVLPMHMSMRRACQTSEVSGRLFVYEYGTAQFGYGVQLPFW